MLQVALRERAPNDGPCALPRFLDVLAEGIVLHRRDGSIISANSRAAVLLGVSQDQLLGRTPMDPRWRAVHSDGTAFADEDHPAAVTLRTGQPCSDVQMGVDAPGRGRRWLSINARALVLGDGTSAVVASFIDITDRLKAADELVTTNEHYKMVAENSSDVVVALDAENRYIWVSPSAEAVLGWTPGEMVGRSVLDFLMPDDHDLAARAMTDHVSGIVWLAEFRHRTADGSFLWMSGRSNSLSSAPSATARVIALRDVHEQVETRIARAAAEARFELLAENASDVVIMGSPDSRIEWVSSSVTRVLGWLPADLIGLVIDDLLHPDDHKDAAEVERLLVAEPPSAPMSARVRCKSGEYRWMRGSVRPLFDADGTLLGAVAGLQDVEEVVSALAAQQQSESMVRAVLDASDAQVLQFDTDCRVEYVNREAIRYHEIAADTWLGRTPEELGFSPALAAQLRRHLQRVVAEASGHHFGMSYDREDGRQWFDVGLSPVTAADGTVEHVMVDGRDVTSRHLMELELTDRATHDRLTGLANREVLLNDIDRALAAGVRSGHRVGLLMIDLDHFKNVNDSLGHEAGDRLLIAATARFLSTVRADDLVARLGGDEFVVVMRELTGIDAALSLAGRVVAAFRSPLSVDGRDMYATTSVGVTMSTTGSTSGDLLREADTALYAAKEAGRDRVAVFNATLKAVVSERLQIEAELRHALKRGELAVWYQPLVDLASGDIVAAEALLRWHHPSGEVYAADRFIDVAEARGLIGDMGDWALVQACLQVARWNAEPAARPLAVGVNMCAQQLADPDLVDKVEAALRASGLEPRLLCIEITETTLLVETPESRDNLRRLSAAGVRIAIDDFGTGYASLAYLRDVRVDTVKIDRSFVTEMMTTEYDRRLIGGIIALAEHLGVEVVAEGVETAEQADTLWTLGCSSGQGFLWSRALPADQFSRLHRTQHDVARC